MFEDAHLGSEASRHSGTSLGSCPLSWEGSQTTSSPRTVTSYRDLSNRWRRMPQNAVHTLQNSDVVHEKQTGQADAISSEIVPKWRTGLTSMLASSVSIAHLPPGASALANSHVNSTAFD